MISAFYSVREEHLISVIIAIVVNCVHLCPVAIMEGLLCIPSCAHELLSDKPGESRTAYTVAAVFKRVSCFSVHLSS